MADHLAPLEDDELEGLAEALASGRISPTCMDIGMLDGFLTAIASGPGPVAPERWLPWVWDAERGSHDLDEGASRQARALVKLVVRHLHGVALALDEDPDAFEPLFYEEEVEGDAVEVPDAWCAGFVKAVEIDAAAWQPLLDDLPSLFTALRLFGTEAGNDEMEAMPDLEDRYEALIDEVEASVRAIQGYWRARRGVPVSDAAATGGLLDDDAPPEQAGDAPGATAPMTSVDIARASSPAPAPTLRRDEPKVGRNDPCPCGSGKKFKACHGRT